MAVDAARLARLLAMLGSEHDGEVLNAARLAQRAVVSAGATWEEVLNGQGYPKAFVDEVARAAYRDGLAEGKALASPKPKRKTFAGYAALLLKKYPAALTEWEVQFCESWTQKRCRPSDKQFSVFDRLASKTGEPIPDALIMEWADVGE
jgi:hypothetical protein